MSGANVAKRLVLRTRNRKKTVHTPKKRLYTSRRSPEDRCAQSVHFTPDLEETTSIRNPKPTVDIRAQGLNGCGDRQSLTLTVWWHAGRRQAEGLQSRTSIVPSLARGQYQSDRLLPSHHTSHSMNSITKPRSRQRNAVTGIVRRLGITRDPLM